MSRLKLAQIPLRDPDGTAETVHDEIICLDPPADRAGTHTETLGNFGDLEMSQLVVAMAPRSDGSERRHSRIIVHCTSSREVAPAAVDRAAASRCACQSRRARAVMRRVVPLK
jgi:hypothetical protein